MNHKQTLSPLRALSLLLAATLLAACASQPAPQRLDDARIIDLGHDYGPDTLYWVTATPFERSTVFEGETEGGYWYSAYDFSTAEHGGTHIDAPVHFAHGRNSVEQIPLQQLIGNGITIDVSAVAAGNPDYQVSIDDLRGWEDRHGRIPDHAIVLLHTGFGAYWPDADRYLGTSDKGPEAQADLHFPGLHPDAARWLVSERNIDAIGLDTASIDYGQSTGFGSHVALMTHDIPAFENLTNLEQLPASGFQVIALPMKIRGGSGGPLRIIAILD